MRVVLATGNYPPDIGGVAFLLPRLASRLIERGASVSVITFSEAPRPEAEALDAEVPYRVVRVPRAGSPFRRWFRFGDAVKSAATRADVILASSLISTGLPIVLARLRKPKTVLRLGGEFFWERYTDCGGRLSLREWMGSRHFSRLASHFIAKKLLGSFDMLVYTTQFQRALHEKSFGSLSDMRVLEHGFPATPGPPATLPERCNSTPFRLLFVGRLVKLKNLFHLLDALGHLRDVHLTIAGSGPLRSALERRSANLGLDQRVSILQPVSTDEKLQLFHSHHLLVLPSLSDVSPRVVLEARVAGLPVLLTRETGLSERITVGMALRKLETPGDIKKAIEELRSDYCGFVTRATLPDVVRTLDDECDDWVDVLESVARRVEGAQKE